MKAVLISIKPKWCELIASGKKTVEVRKTRPKLETPFKCYIYCTEKGRPLVYGDVRCWGGYREEYTQTYGYSKEEARKIWDVYNGHVMGEFVCDQIDEYCYGVYEDEHCYHIPTVEGEKTGLEYTEAKEYGKGKPLYFWHISNLVIYDKPKELSELIPNCQYGQDGECTGVSEVDCPFQKRDYNPDGSINLVECGKKITRPPQSWCYVEELKGENHV